MPRPPRSTQPETPDPPFERADDAASGRDALWMLTQQLHELTVDVAGSSVKTDRLIADLGEVAKDLTRVRETLTLFKGVGMALAVILPLFATVLWWLEGSKIDALRDQMYQLPASRSALPAPPPEPQPPHR